MKTPLEEFSELLEMEKADIPPFIFNYIEQFMLKERKAIELAHSHGVSHYANHGIKAFSSEMYYKRTYEK